MIKECSQDIGKLTAFSIFSGAGGMDIGVMQAGFEILACIELDHNCCDTLRENIKRENRETKVYEGAITSSPSFISASIAAISVA